MLVRDRMTLNPHTVSPDTPVAEALSYMRQKKVRRLPVVDKKGRLVGIISEKDLLYASPSPATSLSVYEVGYLLSKLQLKEIMTKKVTTISPDAPLEEAARVMVDHSVSGLPVLEDGKLVGIITETDVFKTLIEMMGARDSGVRLTLKVQNQPGVLSKICGAIANLGGDIIALGTFPGEERRESLLMVKVRGVALQVLRDAMEKVAAHVVDVREL